MNRRTFLHQCGALFSISLLRRWEAFATSFRDRNVSLCLEKFRFAEKHALATKPIHEAFTALAQTFLGVPYKEHSLDTVAEERLVVDLEGVDCVTFYEYALALARCVKKRTTTYTDFCRELQFIRYRDGHINGYASRLHYTSDYFYNNEQKGVLKNITQKLGGVVLKKRIDFMTTHRTLYPQLADEQTYRSLKTVEEEINKRTLYHIPKHAVPAIAKHLRSGDILGITTRRDGLDCKHTGIAFRDATTLRLLHAPSPGKVVQITKQSLSAYLAESKDAAGIIVARPLEV